jgi:hypothetical protein
VKKRQGAVFPFKKQLAGRELGSLFNHEDGGYTFLLEYERTSTALHGVTSRNIVHFKNPIFHMVYSTGTGRNF